MHRSEPAHADPQIRQSQEAEAARGEAAIRGRYGELESRLGGNDYFCGRFSVADIALFMTVLFALRLKGPRLDGHPGLAAWHARVKGRPAVTPITAEIDAADRVLSPPLYT